MGSQSDLWVLVNVPPCPAGVAELWGGSLGLCQLRDSVLPPWVLWGTCLCPHQSGWSHCL